MSDRICTGFSERLNGTGQCHYKLLSNDPAERIFRARDCRSAARRLRRDGPAGHCETSVQGGLSSPACRGYWHCCGAGYTRCCLRSTGWCLPRPAGKAFRSNHGGRRRCSVFGQGNRSGTASDTCSGCHRACNGGFTVSKEAAHYYRQGRGLCAGRRVGQGFR